MKRHLVFFFASPFLALSSAFASTGEIRGTITAGPNIAPIAGARIVLRGGTHELTANSNSVGDFDFAAVEPGASYSINVEAEGMNPLSKDGVSVMDGQVTRIDLNLQLAEVRTSVLVDAGLVNLDSASADVGQTIDHTEIENLPVTNRTAAKYALLDPHVRQTLGLGADYQDSMRLSINGGSYRHTSYMLDGTSNYDWVYAVTPQAVVLPSAISEVKVVSGAATAQYGSSTNGVIVMTTPSGTDTAHGDFFSYLRPSGIQAPPELATAHIPNQRLDWGGKASGPLVKNRTYAFASYERMKQDRGAVITTPTSTFFDGSSNEFGGVLRLDHNLTSNNTLTARFNGDHYGSNNAPDRISNGNQPSFGRLQTVQSWGGQLSDQAVIRGMVNVARFAYINYLPDSATPLDPSVGVSIDHYNGGSSTQYQAGNSTYKLGARPDGAQRERFPSTTLSGSRRGSEWAV